MANTLTQPIDTNFTVFFTRKGEREQHIAWQLSEPAIEEAKRTDFTTPQAIRNLHQLFDAKGISVDSDTKFEVVLGRISSPNIINRL
jgi:hypothetical protein